MRAKRACSSFAPLLKTEGIAVIAHPSGAEMLQRAETLSEGCVIAESLADALKLLERLKRARPDLPIIIVTSHDNIPMAVRAMRAGALAFMQKPFSSQQLIEAVREAMDLARSFPEEARKFRRGGDRLSAREQAVLPMLLDGLSNQQIADLMGIARRTAEVHRSNVMTKMGAANLAELARMAMIAKSASRLR